MKNTLYFISDITSPILEINSSLNIISESKNSDGFRNGFTARPLLQDGEINGNQRIYERNILEEIVNQLNEKIKKRNYCIVELMHPLFTGDKEAFKKRVMIEDTDRACAVMNKLQLDENNKIHGMLYSINFGKGTDFQKMVLETGYNIGFSLRMMGGIKAHPTLENITVPTKPLHVVTYDAVTNPSHSDSQIIQFLIEDTHQYIGAIDMYNNEVLTESTHEEMMLKDQLNLQDFRTNTVKDFLHNVINQKIIEAEGNLRFNI